MTKGAQSHSVLLRYHGRKMIGVLSLPGDGGRRRFPAVLFLHGFPGAEKSVDIQRALLKRGIASLALNFCGAWGSEGYYSFSDLVSQARLGFRFLRGLQCVDSSRVAVFGFSMGGWAAVNLGGIERRLKAVAALAPVGGPEMLGPYTKPRIAGLSFPLRVKSPGYLYKDFVKAVRQQDPAISAGKIRCPLLLIHGKEDPIVPPRVSERLYFAARSPKKLLMVSGAKHDFLDRREWLTRTVTHWLVRQLKK